MRKKLVFCYLLSFSVSFMYGQNRLGFDSFVHILLQGDVDTMGSARLHEILSLRRVTLLDAREKEEFDVSHISKAMHVGYNSFDVSSLPISLNYDDTVIVSCAIGYRSEKVAQKLKAVGFKNVYNHFGGIFDWTNRGYPVVNNSDKKVNYVHPYNAYWGFWVTKLEKRYEPR